MKRLVLSLAFMLIAHQVWAGCTTSVSVTASTGTLLLAANDLPNGQPRSFVQMCNTGPGLVYYAFGLGAAAITTTNASPLPPLQCTTPFISFTRGIGASNQIAYPPQGELDFITDPVTPNSTVTACDY